MAGDEPSRMMLIIEFIVVLIVTIILFSNVTTYQRLMGNINSPISQNAASAGYWFNLIFALISLLLLIGIGIRFFIKPSQTESLTNYLNEPAVKPTYSSINNEAVVLKNGVWYSLTTDRPVAIKS